MNNLSFEFMERTKSIPTAKYTIDRIYQIKSILALFWIFAVQIYTSFLFLSYFILFFMIGIGAIIAFSKENSTLIDKWEQIFFLLLMYMVFPFYTPMIVYILSPLLLIMLMEFIFQYRNGYFINPVLITVIFIYMCFPIVFSTDHTLQIIDVHTTLMSYFIYSFSVFGQNAATYKDIISVMFGLSPYAPSMFVSILGLLVYLIPFIPRQVYRTFFTYLVSICVFSYSVTFIYNLFHAGVMQDIIYNNIFITLFTQTPIFFVGLFFIPETLGNASTFKSPVFLAIISGFFTIIMFFIGLYSLSPFLGLAFAYITYYILDIHKVIRGKL